MPILPTVMLSRISAELLAAGPPDAGLPVRRQYRLLVVGPAVLTRADSGIWLVPVHAAGSLLPSLAGLRAAVVGGQPAVRIAAALLDPVDLATSGAAPASPQRPRPEIPPPEFYGWSLVYRLPGDGDVGRVDAHEEFTDLPAYYESPLEVADRQEFLGRRGVPSRALALLTNRADFVTSVTGAPRNRYCEHARWRRAGAAVAFGG
jgi:hypothetical protein